MKKRYLQWHRKLSVIVGIPVILWALSGILHPMMGNWFKAEISHKFLRPTQLSVTEILPPAEGVPSELEVEFLSLIEVSGELVYLTQSSQKEFALHSAEDGTAISLETYLGEKARAYTGLPNASVKEITRIDSFNNRYSMINRYLPVYRVSLEGTGLEVVIDPRTGRLARHDVPRIRIMKTLFGWFHTYSFLGRNVFRVLFVVSLSFLALALGITGIANLILFRGKLSTGKKRKMTPGRRAHRIVGGVTYVFYLLFGLSAFFHASMKFKSDESPQQKLTQTIKVKNLRVAPNLTNFHAPVFAVTLAPMNGKGYYRIQAGKEVTYQDSEDASVLHEGEALFVKALTKSFTEKVFGEEKEGEVIDFQTSFTNEYGFIDRRLPVWKVDVGGGKFLYLDTKDSALSKLSTPLNRAEGFSFSMLHKFHFIDLFNKELRDWVSVTGAGLVALTAILGLILLYKKMRSSKELRE